LIVLPNAGHLPHREDPDAVIERVTGFLHGLRRLDENSNQSMGVK
jgi:hypothetical protein